MWVLKLEGCVSRLLICVSAFEYFIGVWVQVVCTVCVGLMGLECVAVVGVGSVCSA